MKKSQAKAGGRIQREAAFRAALQAAVDALGWYAHQFGAVRSHRVGCGCGGVTAGVSCAGAAVATDAALAKAAALGVFAVKGARKEEDGGS